MKILTKEFWLGIAEIIDAFRVFPRAFVAGYGAGVFQLITWFTSVKDVSAQQVAFVTVYCGLATVLLNFYMNSGRKWDK